ncbi:MAG: hypothetical protein WCP68_20780, partial [Enhydrobacter sp.]
AYVGGKFLFFGRKSEVHETLPGQRFAFGGSLPADLSRTSAAIPDCGFLRREAEQAYVEKLPGNRGKGVTPRARYCAVEPRQTRLLLPVVSSGLSQQEFHS